VRATTNTEAHDAYLRGRYLVVQKTQASFEGAAREFEKAIAFDPEYALAHAELAMTSLLLHQGNYGDLTYTEMMARAAPQAERAMVLDPALAEAHTATGYLLWFQDKPEEALAHFRQAIRINPNYSTAYILMANLLRGRFGSYGEPFAMHAKALSLDPLSISAIRFYVLGLIERNRLDEASRELEKLASISPVDYARIRSILTSLGGKWANSALGYLDALRVDPGRGSIRSRLSWMLAILGLEKEALAFSASNLSPTVLRILGRPADAVTSAEARVAESPMILLRRHNLGLALASAGDYTRARPILEEMWQRSGGRVVRSGPLQTDSAAALIAIRRDAGAEAEVGELITAIRDDVRRCHEAGIIRDAHRLRNIDFPAGLAAYLAGEHERGLALIAKAAEDGDFIPPNEAYLQTLYDDPGFAPILASQEARQARERNRFLAIVCTDNPYETVWQPAEGTCERFAAAGGN
jgi:tetratricopeptide (TPR) repeat protein